MFSSVRFALASRVAALRFRVRLHLRSLVAPAWVFRCSRRGQVSLLVHSLMAQGIRFRVQSAGGGFVLIWVASPSGGLRVRFQFSRWLLRASHRVPVVSLSSSPL